MLLPTGTDRVKTPQRWNWTTNMLHSCNAELYHLQKLKKRSTVFISWVRRVRLLLGTPWSLKGIQGEGKYRSTNFRPQHWTGDSDQLNAPVTIPPLTMKQDARSTTDDICSKDQTYCPVICDAMYLHKHAVSNLRAEESFFYPENGGNTSSKALHPSTKLHSVTSQNKVNSHSEP